MSVRTSDKVEVNLVVQSATAVTNMLFRTMMEVTRERGLSSSYLANTRENIERGLFTWLSELALLLLRLEVSFPDSDEALEIFEYTFEYVDDGKKEARTPDVAKLRDFCRQLAALPPGVEYRVKIQREPWSSKVEGWVPCTFKEVKDGEDVSLTGFGYGTTDATLVYRGSSWHSA